MESRMPILIIHGGAGRKKPDSTRRRAIHKKFSIVLERAYLLLERKCALAAVVEAVRLLEKDPEFNAGNGSMCQADGRARLSASVMDGESERFASVVNVEGVANPVLLAQALLKEKHRVLSEVGARAWAKQMGLPVFSAAKGKVFKGRRLQKRGEVGRFACDTVGACALDKEGHLAAASSTGGIGGEWPHRVSDVCMPIANFATCEIAVAATGIGEDIIDEGLCVKIATRFRDSLKLGEAFRRTFREVEAKKRRMGAIAVSRFGQVAFDTTTESLLYAWRKGRRQHFF